MAAKKILLVDDDKAFNFLNRRLIKSTGLDCEVAEALNGRLALQHIETQRDCPNVILLDLNMPVIDGFEFLQRYEKNSRCCKHSKIFVLTSSLRQEDKKEVLGNKLVSGYLSKPLSIAQLKDIVGGDTNNAS
jgi:CheY-like chemotaxis protein